MTSLKSLREELDQLKAEILLKRARLDDLSAEAAKSASGSRLHDALEPQLKELNYLTKTMMDEAETTVSDHPVATVAGALALGIIIGRLTAR